VAESTGDPEKPRKRADRLNMAMKAFSDEGCQKQEDRET
jgi:hypothetical protein